MKVFYHVGRFLLLSLVGLTFAGFPKNVLCQDWRSPIDHPIRLSGTFCELRTNHFHHGIDIKSSKGVSGDPIYSIGDGVIHRLRVQAAGYGNSVYIKHDDGYVSVYGHLLSFSPYLDSIVYAHQVLNRSFEIDINCDSLHVVVKKGERIGKMGSSGYSFGPHLHFEIRDEKTEITLNPLLFNFEAKDNIPPRLNQIRLDFLTKGGRKYGESIKAVQRLKNNSIIKGDTVRIGAWRCGLALRTQDLMDNTPNKNGVYGIDIKVDSQLVYRFRGDSIHFHESRGVNILKDVSAYKKRKERWYLAYDQPASPLDDHILFSIDAGVIETYASRPRLIDISVMDINGNANNLQFFLLRDKQMVEQNFPPYNYELLYHEPNILKLQGAELVCPEGAFYRNQYITVDVAADRSNDKLSNVYSFKGEEVPFHKPCSLSVETSGIDSLALGQAVVLACSGDHYNLIGGELIDGKVVCRIGAFGEYVVARDMRPPSFEVISFPERLRNDQKITLKIYDEYESKGQAKEVQCSATIDGIWIPIKHDVKSNTFTWRMRDLESGDHVFKIEYWDHAGNAGTWTRTFRIY